MGKICVLASGGDAPGMNAFFEAVYLYGTAKGLEVYAAIDGYNGLIDNKIVKMTPENSIGISARGGCVFKCGRCPRVMEHEGFAIAVANIKKNRFTTIIVAGGNGSLIGARRFKNAGVNVIFVPVTIDNDVDTTNQSLGFSSACESSVKMIDMLKNTMETSNRDHVVQLMGRSSNALAVTVGTATFADLVDMEGARHTPEQVAEVFLRNRRAGKMSNMLIMQERKGKDFTEDILFGVNFVKQLCVACKDDNIRITTLGYLQRGAETSCRDRFLAVMYARAAVESILVNQFGVGVAMVNEAVCYIKIELAPIP